MKITKSQLKQIIMEELEEGGLEMADDIEREAMAAKDDPAL